MENDLWLAKLGFVVVGEARKPALREWYVDKNNERLCYVFEEDAKPCDCAKCGHGVRQIVVPNAAVK